MIDRDAGVTAVLGPTNTGKTHFAIERMLASRTGVIGLPLRLLAREVYEKIVSLRGPSVVALVTGEERIVPERVAYWVCTVEAMPLEIGADFVAVDEIQLCADPERGHVFTDRILNARGTKETLFLGSDSIRKRISDLIPKARFLRKDRFSQLKYTGMKKISRMPERSAIVGFSVDEVYAIAEIIRRLKGGAAVVMGALSPRTRNAQVALYQNGDVDYLVSTDAIGMGLNLDINHVAFSGTHKFDGRKTRPLMAHELGQIAGRAGRYQTNGSFGVTGDVLPLEDGLVDAIENHRFAPIAKLLWRNSNLDFHSVNGLIASLEASPIREELVKAREADDLAVLKTLASQSVVRDEVTHPSGVRRLWETCQIPDFRNVSISDHAALVSRIFSFLNGADGRIPADYLARQIKGIDKVKGDIDTISKRLAYIRTWTYVSQREGWLEDSRYWREETRRVEDRLSDALHDALTERFVDRRTSVLMRRLKQKESLVAEVTKDGEVKVDDQFIGRLNGFRFMLDPNASQQEAKTLRSVGLAALAPEFMLRADRMYNSPDSEFDLTEQGGLMWGTYAVGKLLKSDDVLSPRIETFVDDEAGTDVAAKVERRLSHWLDRRIAALFEPLLAIKTDESLTGLARGVGYQLVEALGIIERAKIAADVKSLDQDSRGLLRKHGIRFGQYTIFQPAILKPAPTRLRVVLKSLANGLQEFPEAPPPGLVTIPVIQSLPQDYYTQAGYRVGGARALRIDMLERLADLIRVSDARSGFEATADMLSLTGLSHEQFADLMQGLGYSVTSEERAKVKREPAPNDASGKSSTDEAEDTASKEVPDATRAGSGETPSEAEEPEIETIYSFAWKGRPKSDRTANQSRSKKSAGSTNSRSDRGKKGGDRTRSHQSGPKKSEKKIDPDSPFAALMALKGKT